MTRSCRACGEDVSNELVMQCSRDTCEQIFDLKCLGMKQDIYNALTADEKKQWMCPECVCAKPRRIDSNTPIRSAHGRSTPVRTPPEQRKTFPVCENVNIKRGSSRTGTPVTPMLNYGSGASNLNEVLAELRELRSELIHRLDTHEKSIMDIKEVCFSTINELKELKITNRKIHEENALKESLLENQLGVITKFNHQLEIIINNDYSTQKLQGSTNNTRQSTNKVFAVENQSKSNKKALTVERSNKNESCKVASLRLSDNASASTTAEVQKKKKNVGTTLASPDESRRSEEKEADVWSTVLKKTKSASVENNTSEVIGTSKKDKRNVPQIINQSSSESEPKRVLELSRNINLGRKGNFQQKDVKRGQNADNMGIQAVEQKKHLHVWRLAVETSVESLTSHVKDVCGLEVPVKVDKIKHKVERDYASFIITVSPKEYEILCRPEVWPLNSEFGEWFWFRRPTNRPIEET